MFCFLDDWVVFELNFDSKFKLAEIISQISTKQMYCVDFYGDKKCKLTNVI